MNTAMHPEDLELFEYVEGDLDEERRPALAEHIASCARCAEEVRLLEAGKRALREAPLLSLPPRRRQALLGGLPRQRERTAWSPKRLVAVLTPVAAIVAVIAVVTSTSGDGREGEEAAAPAQVRAAEPKGADSRAEEAPGADAAAPEAAPAEPAPPIESAAQAPLLSVAGPPQEVAAFLRERGVDARVVGGFVEVRGAEEASVRRALEDYPPGDVPVFLR